MRPHIRTAGKTDIRNAKEGTELAAVSGEEGNLGPT
jgi:hypothetical protein